MFFPVFTNRRVQSSRSSTAMISHMDCTFVNLHYTVWHWMHQDACGDRDHLTCYDVIRDISAPSHKNWKYLLDGISHESKRHGIINSVCFVTIWEHLRPLLHLLWGGGNGVINCVITLTEILIPWAILMTLKVKICGVWELGNNPHAN